MLECQQHSSSRSCAVHEAIFLKEMGWCRVVMHSKSLVCMAYKSDSLW